MNIIRLSIRFALAGICIFAAEEIGRSTGYYEGHEQGKKEGYLLGRLEEVKDQLVKKHEEKELNNCD